MRAPTILCVACFGIANFGNAQGDAWPPADQTVHALFKDRLPRTDADFFAIADSLAQHGSTCEDVVAERVMRMNGWTFSAAPPEWEAQVALPAHCSQLRCARYHFLLGALHYQGQNWEQAIRGFRLASTLSQDSTFLSEALNNLSAAFSQQGQYPDSVFLAMERALRFANPAQSPYILNNLAALQIEQKQWERAKQFIDRIPLASPEVRPNLRFNVQLNHLAIAIRTGRLDLARGLVEALDTLEVTAGNACTHARLVSKYFLLADDYEGYALQYASKQSVVATCEATPWQTEGLLYQPWRKRRVAADSVEQPVCREVWAALSWSENQLLAFEMDHVDDVRLEAPTAESVPPMDDPPAPWHWRWIGGIFGLGAGVAAVAFLRWKRRQDEHKALSIKRLRQGLKELRELGAGSAVLEAIDRLESEWLNPGAKESLQRMHPELELSAIEEEVLHMLAHGRSSKEIAQILDISVSYVYNIRGRLRKKLGVQDGEDFDNWAAKQFGVK